MKREGQWHFECASHKQKRRLPSKIWVCNPNNCEVGLKIQLSKATDATIKVSAVQCWFIHSEEVNSLKNHDFSFECQILRLIVIAKLQLLQSTTCPDTQIKIKKAKIFAGKDIIWFFKIFLMSDYTYNNLIFIVNDKYQWASKWPIIISSVKNNYCISRMSIQNIIQK